MTRSTSSEFLEWHGWTLRQDVLVLRSPQDDVTLGPTDLLVAVDETGVEDISDPHYPVFGMGGCAILVGQYHDFIRQPWALMKKRHFDGPQSPLHASGLRATSNQQNLIGEFFRQHAFFRLAAVLTDKTVLQSPFSRYEGAALALAAQIFEVAKYARARRIGLLFESSQRMNALTARTFRDFRMSRNLDGASEDVKIYLLRGSKKLCEPALEVADFVMHAAGKAVQASLVGRRMLDRKDFSAVFGIVPEGYVHFARLDQIGPRSAA